MQPIYFIAAATAPSDIGISKDIPGKWEVYLLNSGENRNRSSHKRTNMVLRAKLQFTRLELER